MAHNFSLCITTFNRKDELSKTLSEMSHSGFLSQFEVLICDDGSKDGTFEFVQSNYPDIILFRHNSTKGLISSRNELLDKVRTPYAFFLDDDASFLSKLNLKSVKSYFENNPNCAVLALRIFWGINKPDNNLSHEEPHRVRSFVGCGHIWRTSAWHQIPNYPEWFKFYGEEDFISIKLFKIRYNVVYFPDILVHHRVNIKSRKLNKDYIQRTRKSLRSGWYLYLMFYPIREIPKRMIYSIWMQIKLKLFNGDLRAFLGLIMAIFDLIFNLPRVLKNSDRLTPQEFHKYMQLEDAKLYWSP